jgi:cell pole-organizing protein PopZ
VLSSCKMWLDRLPLGTKLEPVTTSSEGKNLAEVQARVRAARDEVANLKRAPVPSPDVRQRVERYVAAMASSSIRRSKPKRRSSGDR